MTGQHLTDEQFAELLSGDCPIDASRHMLACAHCQSEFSRVRSSLEDFAYVALEWAEQQASASISAPSVLVRNWRTAGAGVAAAAVLAAALLFGVHQEKRLQAPEVSIAGSQQADSASEVAADDRLMVAIDKEIRWQADSPLSVDDLSTPARTPDSQSLHRLTN